MKVVCPICKKIVFNGSGKEGIKACQHLQGWYSNIDSNLVFASPHFKSDMEAYCKIDGEADESDYINSIFNKKGIKAHLYKGNYVGGCVYPKDVVIFSKVKQKSASVKTKREISQSFYINCIKHELTQNEVKAMILNMNSNNPKDVLAGIKAGKQRRRNIAGRKAAITRKKNARKMAKAKK